MDGENNGNTLFFNGWFGGTIIFGNTHVDSQNKQNPGEHIPVASRSQDFTEFPQKKNVIRDLRSL